jgi:hypothetical protein
MSEQVRKQTTGQDRTGQNDLSDLSASKDLHRKVDTHPSTAQDVASLSISSSNFVRSSTQTGLHSERAPRPIATDRSVSSETKHQTSTSNGSTSVATGIFRNPAYPYRGGLASKIITFFANLLKVLERIFLRLLGARDSVAPTPRHQPAQEAKKEQKDTRESKLEESERHAQVIHRS